MNHLLLINFLEVVVNTFRSSEVPDLPGLQEYIADIGRRFCPFLNPASSRGLVMYSVYELNPGDLEQTQSLLFCIGLLHTEILRRARTNVSLQQRPLVCENIFFRFPGEDSVDGSELFGWPHWLLKTRYTQVGVLFGKFWKGEESISRKESPVPPSPYHMLSISGAVKLRDPQFFKKAPELLDDVDELVEKERDHKESEKEDVSLDLVKKIVHWDRKNKILKDFEFKFMFELSEGRKSLTDRNKFIAGLNLKKVRKYGFTE